MSSSGSSMMYPQQMMAFSSRNAHMGTTTDSTAECPPSTAKPDIKALCELKKKIVGNLPTTCSHCGVALLPQSIIERHTGEVIAYCKAPGACGKSLVLFAGVDLSYPVYKRFCPFKFKEPANQMKQASQMRLYTSPVSFSLVQRMDFQY